MTDTQRTFPLASVLAVSHGLPSYWEDFRDIAEYLTGQPMPGPSHAIGLKEACLPWLVAQHPRLADIPRTHWAPTTMPWTNGHTDRGP